MDPPSSIDLRSVHQSWNTGLLTHYSLWGFLNSVSSVLSFFCVFRSSVYEEARNTSSSIHGWPDILGETPAFAEPAFKDAREALADVDVASPETRTALVALLAIR